MSADGDVALEKLVNNKAGKTISNHKQIQFNIMKKTNHYNLTLEDKCQSFFTWNDGIANNTQNKSIIILLPPHLSIILK